MSVTPRARRYPQVEPGAAALVNTQVAAAPQTVRVGEALRSALEHRAQALQLADRGWVLREDLARAVALGLGSLPARAITRPLPVLSSQAREVLVRRALAGGAPLVIVRDRRGVIGGVAPDPAREGAINLSVAARMARALPPWASQALATLGRLAQEQAARAFLVGGVVRDVLVLGGAMIDRADLDVVAEGDALALARALGRELGAAVTEHDRFLTASLRGPSGERIDVATARSERYEAPGALPRVLPASMLADLARRDFTVNAMAVEIGGEMRLHDPHGGRGDLRRRRLRVLHPLSFVDDPTRIFRAARYAARLDLVYDSWTAACQTLAVRLGPYPALSGPRLVAELERIVAEPRAESALRRLGAAGAFRLLDRRYRFTRATSERIGALRDTWSWADAHGLAAGHLHLTLVALLAGQSAEATTGALHRLGFTGEPLARAARAIEMARGLGARLAATDPGAARARLLRNRTDLELAAVRLTGSADERSIVQWWVETARRVHPVLRGEDVVNLGVRRGPAVAEVLGHLRDRRLDGAPGDRGAEIEYVRHWLAARKEG